MILTQFVHRIRRIKCDEDRPCCKKCTSTGRKCEGYEAGLVSGHASHLRPLLPSRASSPSGQALVLSSRPSSSLCMDNYECLALDYFRRQTAPNLHNSFPSIGWLQLTLQLSLREAPVLRAMAAVGGAHRARQIALRSSLGVLMNSSQQHDSIRQYCRAIAELKTYMDTPSPHVQVEIVVVTCILFVCFEVLQGADTTALAHLRTGRGIIMERNQRRSCTSMSTSLTSPSQDSTLNEILAIFDTLDDQSLASGAGHAIPKATFDRSSLSIGTSTSFTSLAEASAHLETLTNFGNSIRAELLQIARSHASIDLDDAVEDAVQYCRINCLSKTVPLNSRQSISGRLSTAIQAHKSLLKGLKRLATIVKPRTTISLRLRHFFSFFTISMCRETREKQCDVWTDDFIQVLDLVEQLLQFPSSTPQARPQPRVPEIKPQRTFTLESAVVPAVFTVAVKCRSSGVRHRAISLLSTANRQEGLYHSGVLAPFAEDIASVEEGRARTIQADYVKPADLSPDNVPEAARFTEVVVSPDKSRPGMIRMALGRFSHERNGELEIEEEFFTMLPRGGSAS